MGLFKIFIVEDDVWYGEMLNHFLALNPDNEVYLYENANECLDNLYLKPDVICVDYYLPDLTGEELFKRIKSFNSSIPVIIISGQKEISVALEFLRNGVYDYIVKDDNTKELLWNNLLHIQENSNLKKEVKELKKQLVSKYDFEKTIIGQSDSIKKTFSLIESAIDININVSITGETGTGKELVARAIHFSSKRKENPFVAINMAAIPAELAESELFGHEKGAFTGAVSRKTGKFEEANGGTIFLDEIADIPLHLQVKLLRVLQERELVRIGGSKNIKFDVRIITATHKNLVEEVKLGNFRNDLYYRILGLSIELAPLRERGNDIQILAKHFIKTFSSENKIKSPVLTPGAKEKLMKYNYPGNIRELKSIIDLACVLCRDNKITRNDISFNFEVSSEDLYKSEEKTLKEYNNDIISYYLKKHNNNVMKVTQKLGISKSTIYKMIKTGNINTV